MKECTTHHHACDCREEKFRKMEEALGQIDCIPCGMDSVAYLQWIEGAKELARDALAEDKE